MAIKHFVLDVDGVLNTGQFLYSKEGKVYKIFGPDDHDGLKILAPHLQSIHFISADKRGYAITQKRVEIDMGMSLSLVSAADRLNWIRDRFGLEETAYMGDGIFDGVVFKQVKYAIAPANAFHKTKALAHYVTHSRGGEGAVAEASIHLLDTFFEPWNGESWPGK